MASTRKKYKNYLNDPSEQVPRTTQFRHTSKYRFTDDIEHDAQESMEIPTAMSGESATSTPYEDMFYLHKQEEETDNLQTLDESNLPHHVEFEELFSEDISLNIAENAVDDEWNLDLELEEDTFEGFSDQQPIYEGTSLSFHDLSVLLVTLKTTFNLSAIALSFIIKIISLILPKESRCHLRSVKQLYQYFSSQDLSLRKHFYCDNCEFYIGTDNNVPGGCPSCSKKTTDKYFVEIPLQAELQKILQRNWEHLGHRFDSKKNGNYISDVYDGEVYQKLFEKGGFLDDRRNISLLGNTDGVSIFKSSTFSVWPVYVVINELPPKLRFRRENKVLCGLWFGKSKPNLSTFFKPFNELVWKLFTEGFQVEIAGEAKTETCKALLLQMSCESPAKCLFQDFLQFNAYYGCPYCLNPGEYDPSGRSHVYTYKEDNENGYGETRTHEGTIEHARIARQNLEDKKKKYAEKGVKGISWAFSLPSFDIINSMCLDYMHAVLLGVMKQLVKFWCTNKEYLSKADYEKVQLRLLGITPPNNITRVPRSLDDRKHWKASEYRSFLLFYGPACLHGVLDQRYYDHFMLLSSAVWLLLQERISEDDLEAATRHLKYFTYQMSTLYGTHAMTFSVHLLLHLPNAVKMNGPLWCQSCFFFEDYNSELRNFFHSSQHPDTQVVKAVSVLQNLPSMVAKMLPDSPAEHLQRVMKADRYKSKNLTEIEEGINLVGKANDIEGNPELIEAIKVVHDPFFKGKISIYKRALVKGQMIHSASYQKVSQRNSFFVDFVNDGLHC